ncbi:MAG: hypothetical protein IPM79_00925 [Polyangiaceae bacterium]|jgi:hypothetical protein|nr:hypothetical protein [Polyangiaceae bacterium]MBK8936241.1 hypothetical protein [Polyangiaceae bacterium]
MASPPPVTPIVARLELVNGVLGLHDKAEPFDYACSKARAEAIDAILLAALEERGWSLFDDHVVDRVTVEHDGDTRARILIDGEPVTPWWADRVVKTEHDITWHFEREP